MLKALELVGFKSFADKTRFEFPPGITVVVGPNGSGKSNIVDAIKWVLGEQSVKSLRGREMTDVIFNGSGDRRGLNSAEITLTLDNASGRLAVDTPEVHITRRVYRSGEGEYLINRQPCRLRDIRDLLTGTGMATDAYSIIEQGKVDVLLQSSAKDRRVIFEEAAGISRFKARKVEALRRLERVEQNLLRLSDIVDEVDNRLRNVRAQAGKARRYQELADRLQELRTQVGLVDWRRLTAKLTALEADCRSTTEEHDALAASAEALDAQLLELDNQATEINQVIRQSEAQSAVNRERIAAAESTIEHQHSRSRDLDEEIARHRKQLVAMGVRAGDLQQQMFDTRESVAAAEEQHREIARNLAEGERQTTHVMAALDQLRGENQRRRDSLMEQMRAVAALGNTISALESQAAAASATQQRAEARTAELDGQCDALQGTLQELRREREELARRAGEQEELLAAARTRLAERQTRHRAIQAESLQLRGRLTALVERAAVLEELEKRQEGISSGVKEVLALARNGTDGPFGQVCGMVADLFSVSVETAPLVELILGATAQHVVVPRTAPLLRELREHVYRFTGRVGFVWLDEPPAPRRTAPPAVNLEGQPGVIGRADRFVQTEPRYAPLAARLLGRAWMVETLAQALALAESAGPGASFVTLSGEMLAADGTLLVGPRTTAAGLISRRSQLRALKIENSELQKRIDQSQVDGDAIEAQIAQCQQQVTRLAADYQQATERVGENRFQVLAVEQERTKLDQQRSVMGAELRATVVERDQTSRALADCRSRKAEAESKLVETESHLARLAEQISRLETEQRTLSRQTTDVKVELAKSEERLRNLNARLRQFEESQQERQRAISDAREQLAACLERARASQWSILHAESELAELYLGKESFVRETGELTGRLDGLQQQRAALTVESQKVRLRVHKIEEKIHAKQLEANEVRHERGTLVDRLREDYGIDLAELEHEPTAEEQRQREEVQQEIDELRRKLNHLGNVNLESLEELQQLQTRYETLSNQYRDLVEAKAALEKIIDRINADSRRLFAETLQTVKEHFQTLFRDLFGGGRADIILEEGMDILESGIEIVARPPGKEPRSISLLSGGEKTLTCVALLLAIFRSRPSPFCVLDEVDAALDEANIDRFTKVLQDFLAWTQFIIVTHSKKTMTCATTIYGVTMQESGVSKQVSVRFEDVSEDGQIHPASAADAAAKLPAEDAA
jgi:chromosome segregation protein